MIINKNTIYSCSVLIPEDKFLGEVDPHCYHSQNKDRTLTGEIIRVPLETPSKALCDHLLFAKSINDYVRSVVLFSANHFYRSGIEETINKKKDPYWSNPVDRVTFVLNFMRDNSSRNDPTKEWENIAKYAEKYNVGNCLEMAAVGYFYAQQSDEIKTGQISVKIFDLIKGDHLFLLVGSNPNSTLNESDAVICDPWTGGVFPAEQYKKHLRSYKDLSESWIPFNTRYIPFTRVDLIDPDESCRCVFPLPPRGYFPVESCEEELTSLSSSGEDFSHV